MSKSKPKGGLRARATHAWDTAFGPPASTAAPSPESSSALPSGVASCPSTNQSCVDSSVSNAPASTSPTPSIPGSVPPTSPVMDRPISGANLPVSSSPHQNPGSSSRKLGPMWSGLTASLNALHKSSVVFPPLQSAIGGLVACIDMAEGYESNRKEHEALATELKMVSELLDQHLQVSKSPPVTEFILKTAQAIQEQVDVINQRQSSERRHLLLEAERDREFLMSCYRQVEVLFRRLQVDASLSVWSIVNERLANTRLEGMNPVKIASYDSSLSTEINRRTCTKDTRTAVLAELSTWSTDPNAPNVYWMNGMAGTGKTTIACTFAESLKKQKRLAASFFCTRTTVECQDVTRIVPTLAYQLARYSTAFKSALCQVLGDDPDLGSRVISTQFERLIKEPLLEAKDAMPNGLVVIIDALDECTATRGVELVLDMLLQSASELPLKFFVASRPEPKVRHKIYSQAQESRAVFVLHDIEQTIVQADIELYLQEELPSITQSQVKQLAKLSGSLFIYAATAVRYIQAGEAYGDADDYLETMMSVSSKSEGKHAEIDELYTTILSIAVENKAMEIRSKERMRLVLWTAICAREPVAVETLAALAGIGEPKRVLAMLQPLRSVLYISENGNLVSTLHASFPDFMFDRSRSMNFFCDLSQHSQLVTKQCFELMRGQLRFNICGLESSHIPDNKVPDFQERVDGVISSTLAYACRYWADHLYDSSALSELHVKLDNFLSRRLLFWMEAMNLKGWLGAAVRVVLSAKLWVAAKYPSTKLLKSSEDAVNFVTIVAANPVSQSTPHVYVSALPFCDRSSTVFVNYWVQMQSLFDPRGTAISQRDVAMLAIWKGDSPARSVAYSPDGSQLAVGCYGGTILVKDAYDGKLIAGPLKGHNEAVNSVGFSYDGRRIVSGSGDYTIRVWNVQDGTPIGAPFQGHSDYITSVSFSPDGTRVVSGSYDFTVRVWNAEDGTLAGAPFEGHTDRVNSVAFSPNGRLVASGSDDHTIRVWDLNHGSLFGVPFTGHTNCVNSIAFSPDGARIVSGASDTTIRVWSVEDGSIIGSPFEGHRHHINAVAFSLDGLYIVSGSSDWLVRVWDSNSGISIGNPLEGHIGYIQSVAFSPDGTRVVSGSDDATVRVWNMPGGTLTRPQYGGHINWVKSVAFSPDGQRIASGSDDCTIRVWETQDGTLVGAPLIGHTDWVNCVTFSPENKYIASASNDYTVRLWDLQYTPPTSVTFEGHTSDVYSVSFSFDGTRIVSGSRDCTIRVWDVQSNTLIGVPFTGHSDYVLSVSFSPDDMLIVSGSQDSTIRLWDPREGSMVGDPFEGHTGYVHSVAFSPNGRRIASGSNDGTVRIWDSKDGQLIGRPLAGHTSHVESVAFSPDGTLVVSGSSDRTIRVWNVDDGALIGAPLKGHTQFVLSVAFSPDGMHIVSGSADYTVRVWNVCDVQTSTDNWTLNEDGWIVGKDSELLFWVPEDFTSYMPSPYNKWIVGPNGSASVNYCDILLGTNWPQCSVAALESGD